nr:uncharacterized protein LOC129263982 [Lytechinus pictus]
MRKTHRGTKGASKHRLSAWDHSNRPQAIEVRITNRQTSNKSQMSMVSQKRHVKPIQRSLQMTRNQTVKFALWNARSLKAKGKSTALCDFLVSEHIAIAAVTETWLTNSCKDDHTMASFRSILPHLNFHHLSRVGAVGGGIGLMVHKGYVLKVNERSSFTSFEYMDCTLSGSSGYMLRLITVYRPPSNKRNGTSPLLFLEEFSTLVETLCLYQHEILITGDFNFHIDVAGNKYAESFIDLIQSYCLEIQQTGPTHSSGHNLDLIICRSGVDLVSNSSIVDCLPSDHSAVVCNLWFDQPKKVTKHVVTRKLKSIDMDKFLPEISGVSSAVLSELPDVDSFADTLCLKLRETLDVHAPLVERNVILRPESPWYTDTLREAKRDRRRSERRMINSGLQVHRDIYRAQCQTYHKLLLKAKRDFYLEKIEASSQRGLYKLVKTLSSSTESKVLPTTSSPVELADRFADYFKEKIANLRDKLMQTPGGELSVELMISAILI